MFNIDFSTLPEITKKLDTGEIAQLNQLFQDTTIQTNLEEIEVQRKIRQKWKYIIYGGCVIIAIILISTIGINDLSIGIVFASYASGIGYLYKRFSSKIEIPLKTNVLSKICPILYSKLEYSYDEKYSFDEIELLRGKSFLSSFDRIDSVEDSVHFIMERDGKMFGLNGFELQTSEMRGSGKNRRRVITNHCYLMKAIFPNARIPLTSDLKIITDETDASVGYSLMFPIIGFVFSMPFIMIISESVPLGVILGGIIAYGIHYLRKKSLNKNRVKLENIEFEKLFDVKCEDQVTSRMIITPAFMDRIVRFVEKTGNKYEFILQNNVMYIKRVITGAYLEAGTEKNMLTNLTGFVQFYVDMREILLFVNDMNIMYLSKTDTSKTIETSNIQFNQSPIVFSRGQTSSNRFGGFLGKLQFLR